MLQSLCDSIHLSTSITENYAKSLQGCSDSSFSSGPFLAITPSTLLALENFMSSPLLCNLEHVEGLPIAEGFSRTITPLLERLLLSLAKLFEVATEVLQRSAQPSKSKQGSEFGANIGLYSTSWQQSNGKERIVDAELDTDKDLKIASLSSQRDGDASAIGGKSVPGICFSSMQWRSNMISIISSFCLVLPALTCDTLANLLRNEMDMEVHGMILLKLCKSVSGSSCMHVPTMVNAMNDIVEECQNSESSCYYILTAIDTLLESLLSTDKNRHSGYVESLEGSMKVKLSEKVCTDIWQAVDYPK
eukprot:Gb_40158 [translate_table: standard]